MGNVKLCTVFLNAGLRREEAKDVSEMVNLWHLQADVC